MSDEHHIEHQIENVCLTGTYVVGAFFLGLALTAVVFVNVFYLHH